MNLLSKKFKMLDYDELLGVNGGCSGAKASSAVSIKTTSYGSSAKSSGSTPASYGSTGASGKTSVTTISVSGGCSGSTASASKPNSNISNYGSTNVSVTSLAGGCSNNASAPLPAGNNYHIDPDTNKWKNNETDSSSPLDTAKNNNDKNNAGSSVNGLPNPTTSTSPIDGNTTTDDKKDAGSNVSGLPVQTTSTSPINGNTTTDDKKDAGSNVSGLPAQTTSTSPIDGNTTTDDKKDAGSNVSGLPNPTSSTSQMYANGYYDGKAGAGTRGTGEEIEPTSGTFAKLEDTYAANLKMQVYANNSNKELDEAMNGAGYKFSEVGCKMTTAAKVLSDLYHEEIPLVKITKLDTNGDGLLTKEEIAGNANKVVSSNKTVKTDYWEKTLGKEVLDNISNSCKTEKTYVIGRAENVHGGTHWVVLEGYSINSEGQIEFDYNGSSVNDSAKNRRYVLGEVKEGQTETYTISKIETFTLN